MLLPPLPLERKLFRSHIILARYKANVSRLRIEWFLQQNRDYRQDPVHFDGFVSFSSETWSGISSYKYRSNKLDI